MSDEEMIINVNIKDLTPIKLAEIYYKIWSLDMMYGWCYITSHDLTKEQLTKLFGDVMK